MKRIYLILAVILFTQTILSSQPVYAETTDEYGLNITSKAAVVIEGATGQILYEKNKDDELPMASVTKVMTLLLIFEALDSGKINLTDEVSVSEYAASMGGSQVYLEVGEKQNVDTMIKCIAISSANDAAVAMAEYISGSESSFVEKMNSRAAELGMNHTHFINCNGLDDNIESGHYSSAYDIALMSRELLTKHPQISDYSTVWMDSFIHTNSKGEQSEFGLTNTNKLIRSYNGITGLKTGSTKKAGYCLSATAKRDGLDMISVVLSAPDHKTRFSESASLLDYGFGKCIMYKDDHSGFTCTPVKISGSLTKEIAYIPENTFCHTFTNDEDISLVTSRIVLNDKICAPINKGDVIGTIEYSYNGTKIGQVNLISETEALKAGFIDYYKNIITSYMSLKYSS
jgi:serine-type D-ala-D-ala carboxypeptidase